MTRHPYLICVIILVAIFNSKLVVANNTCQSNAIRNSAFIPYLQRVRPQTDIVKPEQVINSKWVAVGIKRDYALQQDCALLYLGQPAYRFELNGGDNTLSGYKKGTTKGRIELASQFALADDLAQFTPAEIGQLKAAKTIYHYGRASAQQGEHVLYKFALYLPKELSNDVNAIFAQWHGMPDRTLIQTPKGEIKKLSYAEFEKLSQTMLFRKNKGYEKVPVTNVSGKIKRNKHGEKRYKRGQENGYLVEQGGYPPLAFGFNNGYFYIKTNSDAKWLSDKTDRTNASVKKHIVNELVFSKYKESMIPFKMPITQLPKETWLEFRVEVKWSSYDANHEKVIAPGSLDVVLTYFENRQHVVRQLVKQRSINLGRNDEHGYYFKFGIYRVGNSTVPTRYHLAGFEQQKI